MAEYHKHYDSDWAKAKSRDLVGKLLDETLLKFRRPQDLKVLHFGGLDLAEAQQVYLPRGILPQNIISIEQDRDIAQAQQAKGLGIQIVHATLEEYLNSQKEIDFDVVSLDYTGPLRTENLLMLDKIVRNQKKDHWLLHHANLARRDDRKKYLELYANGRVINGNDSVRRALESKSGETLSDIFFEEKEKAHKLSEEGNFRVIKDQGYSIALQSSFLGATPLGIERLFRFATNPLTPELIDIIKKKCDEEKISTNGNPIKSFLENFEGGNLLVQDMAFNIFKDGINGLGPEWKRLFRDPEVLKQALMAISDSSKESRFFANRRTEQYSYISESGSPMIGDVVFLSFPRRAMEYASNFARIIGYPNKLNGSRFPETLKEFGNYLRAKAEFRNRYSKEGPKSEERQFLGNSSKPVLTKTRCIEAFQAGKDIEQIRSEFRGWTNMPLAQWRAHHTMGTYNSGDNTTVEKEIEVQDNDRITAEEARDLLGSGIPIEEIIKAWPNSFSAGQLRAFKAHLTMGTYEKKGENKP